MKVDTGADTCILTIEDLQRLKLSVRCDLVLEDDLILKGDRVVVPESLHA